MSTVKPEVNSQLDLPKNAVKWQRVFVQDVTPITKK